MVDNRTWTVVFSLKYIGKGFKKICFYQDENKLHFQ